MARLLVIDDDENICLLLREEFSLAGHSVQSASDGPSGLAAAHTTRPDLVILDLKMPGMSGLEVLERLKGSCPALPVLLFTAYGDCRDQARALGADAYVVKSCNLSALTEAVVAALAPPAAAEHALRPPPRSSSAP